MRRALCSPREGTVSHERGTPVRGPGGRPACSARKGFSASHFLSHNELIRWSEKINCPTKPSTVCQPRLCSAERLQSSGDTTPCRMTGVTLHSHVHCKEVQAGRPTCSAQKAFSASHTGLGNYRGTSLMRNRPPLEPQRSICIGSCGAHQSRANSYEQGTPVGVLVSRLSIRDSGLGIRVSFSGLRVSCFVLWIPGSGFRVSGFGFRVPGFGVGTRLAALPFLPLPDPRALPRE